MTIFVEVSTVSKIDEWHYWYDDEYHLLSLEYVPRNFPQHTLQGTYSVLVKSDPSNVISYFEALPIAGPRYREIMKDIKVPEAELGRVVVVQDIDDHQKQTYFTDTGFTVFYTRLGDPIDTNQLRHVAIGKQVLLDITTEGMLAGVWMLDLPPEISAKYGTKVESLE